MSDLLETSPRSEAAPPAAANTPTIEAVLFDYGQVLSQGPNVTAWERLRAIVGGSAEVFHKAYWDRRHDYDRGALNGAGYWNDVAQRAGHPGLNDGELGELFRTDVDLWTDLNQPMVTWAAELQRRGFRTGILSNIGDRMEAGIREKFDWIGAFQHCTWSHRLNMAKPEIAIYKQSADDLATRPERILFVDDREENIDGARTAGMVAVRYTTHEQFLSAMRELGLESLL